MNSAIDNEWLENTPLEKNNSFKEVGSTSKNGLSSDVSELMYVSCVDAEIKNIVSRSNSLYLVALNAMLRARQLDQRAAGFRRCTQDIRLFSDRLELHMRGLLERINNLVNQVSLVAKRRRLVRILAIAGIENTRVDALTYLAELNEVKKLVSLVHRQTEIGENLVTRALIESALTDNQQQLTLVAREMEKSVVDVRKSLTLINGIIDRMEQTKS